jgi:triacylglycerol esterase/lipase EstA (alpha/beta hydrolase family)
MSLFKKSASPLLILWFALILASCTNDPYFKKAPTYIAYKDAPPSILNRAYITPTSQRTLFCMKREHRSQPATLTERVAIAEREIFRAKNILRRSRKSATAHYLKAAKTLWPVVKTTQYPHKNTFHGEGKRLLIAHQIYTHAVGQTARYITSANLTTPGQSELMLEGTKLRINTSSPNTIHPSYFDHINPLDTYRYAHVGPKHKISGLGIAANGHRNWSEQRYKENPLIPPYGIDIPINIIIDYTQSDQPRLTITNLLKTDTSTITGEKRQLSADYSAPIAAMMDDQSSFLGLLIAIDPLKYKTANHKEHGLFALGAFDPDKIPVIFIHGLISQPSTWTQASNYLLQDKTIRENYQFYYYFYPTGVTPMLTGAKLRQTLLKFYAKYGENNPHLQHTVLVGHSMGGLLSSIQSRMFTQELWHEIFKDKKTPSDTSEQANDDDAFKEYKTLFSHPQLTPIERTVFICTPHLGSEIANGWIGKIGSALIELPKNVASLQLGATLNSMTDFGRAVTLNSGPPNSVNRLKPNNPSLKLLKTQPFSPRITYHTILGNRGRKGPIEQSSDGVVPYWSSHIEGAASEKVVPTNHESLNATETEQEISRILHLHLQTIRP